MRRLHKVAEMHGGMGRRKPRQQHAWQAGMRWARLLLLGGVLLALAGCGDAVEVEEEDSVTTSIIGVTGASLNGDGYWRGPCQVDGSDGRVFGLILQGETGLAHDEFWVSDPTCTGPPTGVSDDPFSFASSGTKTNTWQGGSPPAYNPGLPTSLTVSLVLVLDQSGAMPITMIIDDTITPRALYLGAGSGPVDAQGFPNELEAVANIKQ